MALVLENVSKTVNGEPHLTDISMTLKKGAVNVLFGQTQAGKTSLMRLMAGLDRPSGGRILMGDENVTGRSVRKRNVAMVYQEFINYPSFTIFENIASPLRRAGVARKEIDRRVREVARTVHIENLLDRLPSELSGGQQQRTALARALVKNADLLILDEPLVNLDYKLREEMRDELRGIFSGGDTIVVYATTEPLEALMLGGETAILHEGRVLQAGKTLDVYNAPNSITVGSVFSDPPINVLEGMIHEGRVTLGASVSASLPEHMNKLAPGRHLFGVRAHHLFVARQGGDDLALKGHVELAEFSGSETFVHIAHSGVSWVIQEEGVHGFELGEQVTFFVSPESLFVFDESGNLEAKPGSSTGAQGGG